MNQARPSSPLDQDTRFQSYYDRYLQPLEQRFESLRRDAVKERNRRAVAALAAWLVALGGVLYMAQPIGEVWPFVAFFGLVTLVGLGMWAWLPAGAHELRLQEQVLSRIVPFFGDLRYKSEPDLVPGGYHDWLVLPYFTKTSRDDQIEGSYRGVRLKLVELSLQYEVRNRSNSSSSLRTAFKGMMIDLGLAQEYPGVTLIRSRGSDMNGRFRLDNALAEVGSSSGFEVFATDDAPGATLADASFLERLAIVSSQFEARQLFASFHQNRLVMLIEHKGNYFEMSHRQETDFARDAERVRDQLGRLFAIVDLLQLPGETTDDEGEADAKAREVPEFPELPDPQAADPYDIGGWGCLSTFVMFGAAMLAYLWLLDSELSKGALLWWSAFGGSLLALGLFQGVRGAMRRSGGAVIFGLILLAGAFVVLYYTVPPETQALFQSWLPGL